MGHESWHETVNPLLRKYPEFDETPHVQMPEKYERPDHTAPYFIIGAKAPEWTGQNRRS